MRAHEETVARRYARALLDVATTKGTDPAVVKRDLDLAVALLETHADLRSVLEHPAIPVEKKKSIVAAVWAAEPPVELVRRLVDLLLERQRAPLLRRVALAYSRAWNTQRGVLEAEATSATTLEPESVRALGAAVEKATGRKVELRTGVDPRLLGGVLLRMDGRVYDGSVRARLSALRERLAGPEGA